MAFAEIRPVVGSVTRILLVEDDPVFARAVAVLLAEVSQGPAAVRFAVDQVADLQAARQHLSHHRPHAALLDLELKDSGGLDTLRRLKAMAPRLPVVVLTATADQGLAQEALRLGAQDYLVKDDVRAPALARALTYAIERQRSLDWMAVDARRLTALLDSLGQAVIGLEVMRDADGGWRELRLRILNRRAESFLGDSARNLTGARLDRAAPFLAQAPGLTALLKRVAERGEPGATEVAHPQGGWFRIAVNRLQAERNLALILTVAEITEARQREAELRAAVERAEAADNAKSQVLSAISHDVRTPLNSIVGFTDLIRLEAFGPLNHPQYGAYVNDIAEAAGQLQSVVDDMLERRRFEEMQRLEGGYRHLIDLAPDLIAVVRGAVVEMINPAGAALLGVWPAETLVGRRLTPYLGGECQVWAAENWQTLLAEGEGGAGRRATRLVNAAGQTVDVELAAMPFDDSTGPARPGDPPAVMIVARDVTERLRTTRALEQREARLSRILEAMVDGLVIYDDQGVVETYNPAAERLFGYPAEQVIGRDVTLLLPEGISRGGAPLKLKGRGLDSGGEVKGRRMDGSEVPLEVTVSVMRLQARTLFIAVIRDVTERHQVEERLRYLATRDPLTGLPNRSLFADHLDRALARAGALERRLAVLLIDLDQFKTINDTMGHLMGDRVLQVVGRRLEAFLRPGDFAARHSGDEFTVILDPVDDQDQANQMAARLLERLAEPMTIDGREIFTTGSLGVIVYPDGGEDGTTLMRHVDTAVNHAKLGGRNTVQAYTGVLSEGLARRLELENGLRRAIERDELHLLYQPKMDLTRGRVVGAEALLRWTSPHHGAVSPAEFVPIAEACGLIGTIGDWVIRRACADIQTLEKAGSELVPIAVNLSPRQFRRQDLPGEIAAILETYGVRSDQLELELTESMLVEDAETAVAALSALKQLGLRLSIDDFGTGYSSLSYLKRFPIDYLKIDQSFVRDIPANSDDMAITKAIIAMGTSLGLKLIAEGVESEDQVRFLVGNGVLLGQGFHYARPLDRDTFAAFVARANGG
ncbi:EAL domain-containing protein [Roseospirillum parvum]|uniref:histidine kinase n=1 Tax=Roseospirillum parvum TaxID=83401 RepID=A0A1G8CK01_9PROT|nr:EAL domain-containing protein [Roseospirillum parvum]SDH45744.1 PAS domain S-box-containing protein/diguanylate cyclase (GGDEF) domain-containing protein [Roseospirillum parvum]